MCPSGWQLSQENVPVEEASASLNAMRPWRSPGSVGSSSWIVAVTLGAETFPTSTSDTVLETVFSTQASLGAPSESDTSAMPRGTAPTATRPRTSPVPASTVKSLSEPAAVATSVESSSLTRMPKGVASAMPSAGCSGGSGSRSKRSGDPQAAAVQGTRVIWLRKARFSISSRPCPCVPARPLATLRASAWATKTVPSLSTARP